MKNNLKFFRYGIKLLYKLLFSFISFTIFSAVLKRSNLGNRAHPINSLNKAPSVTVHCLYGALAPTCKFSFYERTRSNRSRDWCCGVYTCTCYEQTRYFAFTNTVTPCCCTCSTRHCELSVSGDGEFINVARESGAAKPFIIIYEKTGRATRVCYRARTRRSHNARARTRFMTLLSSAVTIIIVILMCIRVYIIIYYNILANTSINV